MRAWFCGLIFLLVGCSRPTQELPVEAELAALEHSIEAFNQAFAVCDIQRLQQLTTNDYTHTNGSSKAITREQWFNYLKKRKTQLKSGQLVIQMYELSEKEIKLYRNAALLTGKIKIEGVQDSVSFSRELRVSNLWVLDEQQWKRAGFHDTRIH